MKLKIWALVTSCIILLLVGIALMNAESPLWYQTEAVPKATFFPAELVDRGKLIFEQAKCWECHGKDGRGNGPKANELKDDWGYPVRPRDFTSEKFKRGASVEDISLTVAAGLNGTPMASYRDAMPARDILSVAAYLSLKNLTLHLHLPMLNY